MHDNLNSEVRKLRSEGNCTRHLQITRSFGKSSRPNRVINRVLVNRINPHVLNWRIRSSVSDCKTLQVEIIITRILYSIVTLENNYQPIVKTLLAKLRKIRAGKKKRCKITHNFISISIALLNIPIFTLKSFFVFRNFFYK